MSKLTSSICKVVSEISDIPISGNIIPNSWWLYIRRNNNKPYDQAIIILADIIYWYRKQEIRDEITGHTVGFKQKFAADKLQRSYDSYAKQFGYSKKQVKCAIAHLVSLEILSTEFRTVNTGTMILNNVLYIEPNPQRIRDITTTVALKGKRLSPKKAIGSDSVGIEPVTRHGNTYTKTTPETTPENTTTVSMLTADNGSLAAQDGPTLSYLLDIIPTSEHCSRLTKTIAAALSAYGEGYVMSNIQYCLAKHKPMEGANSLGGMMAKAFVEDYARTARMKINYQIAVKEQIAENRRKEDEQKEHQGELEAEQARIWCKSERGQEIAKKLFQGFHQ